MTDEVDPRTSTQHDSASTRQPARAQRPHPRVVWDAMHTAGVTGTLAHRWVELLLHHAMPRGDRFNACSVNLLSPRVLNRLFGFSKNVGTTVRDPMLDAGVVVALRRRGQVRLMMHFDARCQGTGPAPLDENGVCPVCRASLQADDDDRYPFGSAGWRSAIVTGPNPPAMWPSQLGDTRLSPETQRLTAETQRLSPETLSPIAHINDQTELTELSTESSSTRIEDDDFSDADRVWVEAFPESERCPTEHRAAVEADIERYGYPDVAAAAGTASQFGAATWAYVQKILERDAARLDQQRYRTPSGARIIRHDEQLASSKYGHLFRE